MQDTLGKLDEKVRLASRVAAERGWTATKVVGALVLVDGTTVRRRVNDHADLFAPYGLRGRAAYAWVRRPRALTDGIGILVFASMPDTNRTGLRRAGQRRVRPARLPASVDVPVLPA
jgi:hypothetical protein